MNVVIAYDIRDDSRRARVAARLATCGVRLQRSVFECVIDDEGLEELVDDVRGLLDDTVDVMQVFRQCVDCGEKRHDLGQVNLALEEPFWVV